MTKDEILEKFWGQTTQGAKLCTPGDLKLLIADSFAEGWNQALESACKVRKIVENAQKEYERQHSS